MNLCSPLTSLTFAMGTRDEVAPELPPAEAASETAEVDEGGPAELDGVGVGVDDGDDDGIGAGLAALAWCNACREFSSLVITALWSVWMQFNLGGTKIE